MLHHPNIIEYYDSFAHEKSMMIVMEYASGGTLFDLVETRAADQVIFTMWRNTSTEYCISSIWNKFSLVAHWLLVPVEHGSNPRWRKISSFVFEL